MLRIQAGAYKRRKIGTEHLDEVRPSLGRVRETLFNWLAPYTSGARCLDAFAGSGSLGLEALSRSAQRCYFVDSNERSIKALQSLLISWGVLEERYHLVHGNCPQALRGIEDKLDLVFLDPPFAQPSLMLDCIQLLLDADKLADGALIYCELARAQADTLAQLPPELQPHKQSTSSSIIYSLLRYQP